MIQDFEHTRTNIFFFYKVSNLQKREKDVNFPLEIILGYPKHGDIATIPESL